MTKLQASIDNGAVLSPTISDGGQIIVTLEESAVGEFEISNDDNIQAILVPDNNEINVQIIGSGAKGKDGLNAYEMWLEDGNQGTIDDFFNSLKGVDGRNYIHPDSHSADMIIETEEKQFVSIEDKLRLSGYIHDQIMSSEIWIVSHTLDKYPSVSVVDTGGNLVFGDVEYINKAELKIFFNHEFSGKAYLN